MKGELGKLIAVYPGAPVRWRDLLLVFFPSSLLVLALLAYGIRRADYGYRQHGPVAAEAWSQPWFLAGTAVTLVLLLLSLVRILRAHRCVSIYENGLRIYYSPLRMHAYPWNNLSGVAFAQIQERLLGIDLRRRQRLVLYRAGRRFLKLDNLVEDSQELATAIKAQLYPRLLPTLTTDLQEGRWLDFGRLAIHRDSIRIGRHQVAWKSVSRLGVRSGHLVVESDGLGELSLPISHLINLEILLQLIEQGINPKT